MTLYRSEMTRFSYYEKPGGVMVVGLDDCMGDWGWIAMDWQEFEKLDDNEKDRLGEESFQ